MRCYVPSLIYAVCRAPQWKCVWKHTLHKEFNFFAAGELQFEMGMAFAGRSKVISSLMWLRSKENQPIRDTDPSYDDSKTFLSWWSEIGNKDDHEEFISVMSRCFHELLPDEGPIPRVFVLAGLQAYLDFYLEFRRLRKNKLRKWIVNALPEFSKPIFKRLVNHFLPGKLSYHTELLHSAKCLEGLGVSVDFLALEEIQKTIIQFHENRSSVGF